MNARYLFSGYALLFPGYALWRMQHPGRKYILFELLFLFLVFCPYYFICSVRYSNTDPYSHIPALDFYPDSYHRSLFPHIFCHPAGFVHPSYLQTDLHKME